MFQLLPKEYYIPFGPEQWKGRTDGPRLHQKVVPFSQFSSTKQRKIALLGFACDEGIRRNSGRVGASEGPFALRKAASNLPLQGKYAHEFYDCGDIICKDGNLETAQQILADSVTFLHKQGLFPIVFGGGHEIAYGHFKGIRQAYPHTPCGIINFDAHFDLRPTLQDNKGTSGSPFLQIAELEKASSQPFRYRCLGIQAASNTAALFESAIAHEVAYVTAEDMHRPNNSTAEHVIKKALLEEKALYVSLCLDVFAAAYAPGVSAPQPLGLLPHQVIPLLKLLAASNKLLGFDIAELSPPFDQQQQTAQLAAHILHSFINHLNLESSKGLP